MNTVSNPIADAQDWVQRLASSKMFDLSQPMRKGIPVHPAHPPFHITLNNRHGDVVRRTGHSSTNELMVTSTHSGTHIDALCHVSDHGRIFGERAAAAEQRGISLFPHLGAETIGPIFRRAVLLDIAKIKGVDRLAPAYTVTPADLEAAQDATGTEVRSGDIVLLRTGWGADWAKASTFLGLDSAGAPGPGAEAAHWLADRKPFAAGSDTSAFEVMNHNDITLEVHQILIARHGIHLIENLNLEGVSREGHNVFLFVALPLPIVGATASPLAPVAVV